MNQTPATTPSDTPHADRIPETFPAVEQCSTWHDWLRTALTVILVAALLFLGTWRNYWANGRQNQYDVLVVGRCVYHGGHLCVHAFDGGMPGVSWLSALGYILSGGRAIGGWVLPGVTAVVAIALLAMVAGRLLNGRAGRRIAILSAVVLAVDLYGGTSISPVFYGATCNVAAIALFLVSLGSWRIGWRVVLGIGAGLAWAAALAMTHTGCIGLVVVTLVGAAIAAIVRSQRGDWLATIGCAWTGFLVGVALIIVALESSGVASTAWANFTVLWREQCAGVSMSELWQRSVASLSLLRLHLWFVLVGGIAAAMGVSANHLARSTMTMLGVWWIVACGLVVTSPVSAMNDWAMTFPPMFCLVAIGIYHVGESLKDRERKLRIPVIIAILTIVVLLGRPLFQQFRVGVREARMARVDDHGERNRLRELGEKIREFVPQHRRIYVLDGSAGVYVHADRSPASAVIRPMSAADIETVLSDLEAQYAFALVVSEDAISLGPACDDTCTGRLQRLVAAYDEVAQAAGYTLFVRKSEHDASEVTN